MKKLVKTVKYFIFACIATSLNIGTQKLFFVLYTHNNDYSIYIAMLLGTVIGFITKYFLDKNFIFYYKADSGKQNFFLFVLYSAMGVVTTVIFWGTELLFDYLFPFDEAKYIGAIIGLSIGYTSKYFLDKKFVFKPNKG